jgi:hypothetical protein
MSFDPRKAHLQGADMFRRFRVPPHGEPLARAGLSGGRFLLIFERGGRRHALDATQMTYHHVAQGMLAGEPFVVTF